MKRLLLTLLLLMVSVSTALAAPSPKEPKTTPKPAADNTPKPAPRTNVVFILADDLGYGDLGSYGQKRIRTPNLDRLALDGMRFTQFYTGSPLSAPARATLLTGLHQGHAAIRDNLDVGSEGQMPLPNSSYTLAHLMQQQGYLTACIGKWGLGATGTNGDPLQQGFDYFYGYNGLRQALNAYPQYLWRSGTKETLKGNLPKAKTAAQYAPDLITADTLRWVRAAQKKPFFLYLPLCFPRLASQVPNDSLREYANELSDPKRANYAATITRMDREVGQLLDLLKELSLEHNTLVIFSSDGGSTFETGGADIPFFDSNGGLHGNQDLGEGTLRVPLIIRWPNKIQPQQINDLPCAAWDIMPTLADISGAIQPENDGFSLLPTLLGQQGQKRHGYLYWEFHAGIGGQAVRVGDWKGVRTGLLQNANTPIQLFNVKDDPQETTDSSSRHAGMVELMRALLQTRTPSAVSKWNF